MTRMHTLLIGLYSVNFKPEHPSSLSHIRWGPVEGSYENNRHLTPLDSCVWVSKQADLRRLSL